MPCIKIKLLSFICRIISSSVIKTYAMFGSKYRKDGERSCCCMKIL
ncbi:hypothetical protein [Rickettsia endosymbiont of Gonocerus acuteangulatus]